MKIYLVRAGQQPVRVNEDAIDTMAQNGVRGQVVRVTDQGVTHAYQLGSVALTPDEAVAAVSKMIAFKRRRSALGGTLQTQVGGRAG